MRRSTSSGCNQGPKMRRSSIHDITSVHDGDSQGPITSQHSVPASVPEILGKHQPPAGNPQSRPVPAIGHPVPGSHALGTPFGPLPPNSVPPHMAIMFQGGAIKNQMENVCPENQMEDAYPENQAEKTRPENQKMNTKNTYPKPHERR